MRWVLLVAVLTGALSTNAAAILHGGAAVGVGGAVWLAPLTLLVRRLFPPPRAPSGGS